MASIIRAQHWIDEQVSGRSRRRTIGNWQNFYSRQSGLYEPVDLEIEDDQTEPPEWEGTGPFSFRYQVKRGNLQIFAHDLATPNDAAVIGIRRADNPSHWLVMKALGGNTGSHIVYGPQKAIRWPDYWPNANLNYQATSRGVRKRIDLLAPGHPVYFEFSLKMPAAADVQSDGNGGLHIVVGDQNRMHLPAPYGWDSTPDAETQPNIRVVGSVESNVVSGQYRNVVIRLTPDVNDLAGATYPVFLDPSVNISGTVFVKDTFLDNRALYLHANYGSSVYMSWGYSVGLGLIFRQLMRVDEGEIPAGTITDFKLHYWRQPWAYSITAGMTEIFSIKDANDWVEGTANGTVQAGSPGWNHAKHDTQDWAGSVGCGTSGTDYDADGSPPGSAYPIYTSGPSVERIETLKTEWAMDWRDGLRVNNGILIKEADEATGGKIVLANSTEAGSDQPYFEIDYGEAGNSIFFGNNF